MNVTGSGDSVGGLVGYNWGGTLTQCYATGAVSGGTSVGGLVGVNGEQGAVTNCYSRCAVKGCDVGGLISGNDGDVHQCYGAGTVSGCDQAVGGLVEENWGSMTACFWDIQTSGQTESDGGTGKTTAQMKTAKTFLDAGWDFAGETKNGTADIWRIVEGKDYPRLSWELTAGN